MQTIANNQQVAKLIVYIKECTFVWPQSYLMVSDDVVEDVSERSRKKWPLQTLLSLIS